MLNLCLNSDKINSTIGCLGTGPLYEKALEKKLEVKLLNTKDFLNGGALAYIVDMGFDVVDFHGAKAFFLNKLIAKKMSIPSVATVHSNYRQDFLNSGMKHLIFTPLSITGLKSFNYYICVSKYIDNLLNTEGFKGRKFVVSNGMDFKGVQLKESREQIRASLGINSWDFVYVMVARLHPVKNHKRLINAFTRLKLEFKDTRLLLIGDGSLLEQLKSIAPEGVIFAGFRENPADYINASDISVLSSLSEGGAPPLVILESAAVKKTAAVSRVGDMPEIISSGSGFLFDPCSEEEIYEKLKEAYLNRNRLPEMGEALHSAAVEMYSMDKFCSGYSAAYNSIIEDYNGKKDEK